MRTRASAVKIFHRILWHCQRIVDTINTLSSAHAHNFSLILARYKKKKKIE